ncbi:MAG: PD40 domain-containing protein [Bacteroidales bacterium]|nr:PD40 domain-containing protein [Bacteroidales bacterium]MBN2634029.1 PD40 domain-containing protein [Bacteroidales bacterium]
MKRYLKISTGLLLSIVLMIGSGLLSCKKEENPIKFPFGTFPDTATFALQDLNSEYDDYNLDIHQIYDNVFLFFSSNRNSMGDEFDLVQGMVSFVWDQTTGAFGFGCEVTSDPFLTELASRVNSPGNEFGPYRFFSTVDGYEYLLLSSQNEDGDLDFYYCKNQPSQGAAIPAISGPYPVSLLNTVHDDAYISFDNNQDTAVFSTNVGGNFDIFIAARPAETDPETWFSGLYSESSVPVDSVNSSSEDKCPFIFGDIMVFASDRPGGMGGFDLYMSLFRNGKWSTAENLGPDINTQYDEYRPVTGTVTNYTNLLLMFSSNRPGGQGGYDLYFRGMDDPLK